MVQIAITLSILSSLITGGQAFLSTGSFRSVKWAITSSPYDDADFSSSSSLTSIFNLAIMMQRAGSYDEASQQYEIFLDSAAQVGAPAESLAEVHCNLGQIRARKGDRTGAQQAFEEALRYRSLPTAHVNLALLSLAEGESLGPSGEKTVSVTALEGAKRHCELALVSKDGKDEQTIATATKILRDVSLALRSNVKSEI